MMQSTKERFSPVPAFAHTLAYRIVDKTLIRENNVRIATLLTQFGPLELNKARAYARQYGARILLHEVFDAQMEKRLVLDSKIPNLMANALLIVRMLPGHEHAPVGYSPNEI